MSETLRVLQVEDSESDAALMVRLLEKSGYRVHAERVEEAEPMRRALAREDWDVVIADFQLPQFDAGAALEILHESGRDIPFIVVSGMIGEDRAVEMMRAGAHDYVLKDRIARLVPAVQREIRECQSRGERRRAGEPAGGRAVARQGRVAGSSRQRDSAGDVRLLPAVRKVDLVGRRQTSFRAAARDRESVV